MTIDQLLTDGYGLDLSVTMRALSNADRIALVTELGRRGESSIIDLAESTSITRFAASRHLAILDEAGVVAHRWVGATKLHSLRPGGLDAVEDWVISVQADQ
jgi:DNA-binding transcriptional ArsR family regulator